MGRQEHKNETARRAALTINTDLGSGLAPADKLLACINKTTVAVVCI